MFYTPGTATQKTTHVRDALDSKRMMIIVWLALFPALFYGMYNVGHQSIQAITSLGNLQQVIANDWHYALAQAVGIDLTSFATTKPKVIPRAACHNGNVGGTINANKMVVTKKPSFTS